jgi:hypothetical protein
MTKTKKIYRYVNRMVERCFHCNNGWDTYLNQECYICKGSGGKWERVKVLVSEEVTNG